MMKLAFREVTEQTLPDFISLFESPGAPKNCWCRVWRRARATDRSAKKAAMIAEIRQGVPVGILGYSDETPVAWCSIAPRDTYRDLGGADYGPEERVWSIVCFYVRRSHRGQGVFGQLLRAAIAHAQTHGATLLEAYPVDPGSPSYRFMGFVPAFEKAGFVETGRAGARRYVMALSVVKRPKGRERA